MKAIVIHEFGGADRLAYEEVPTPPAGAGQVRVRVHAIGVNFIDIYYRTGLYQAPLPLVVGQEAAGVVDEVGEGVTGFQPGDRVGYCMALGSYAECHVVPAAKLLPLPDQIDFRTAAGCLLQGMTAHYLTHSTWPLRFGETCLVHAAAGGTGQWIAGMAKQRGARVLGTCSTAAKAELASAAGCDDVILYGEQDFESEVKRLTDGAGVDVVYDSVGASTWDKSLNCLRPRGMMVSFGNASGAVPAMMPLTLSQKGSLFLTRPNLGHYTATRQELEWRSGDVFLWLLEGKLKLQIGGVFPLSQAAQAQQTLASRQSCGKLLLIPDTIK
jgi:NADPH:quinone reductase